MLSTTTLLFLVPTLASAKLWGWPDEFTIHRSWGKQSNNPISRTMACQSWYNFCNENSAVCTDLQLYNGNGGQPRDSSYVEVRMENAAWMDLWRAGNTGKYDIFEHNGDGSIAGYCTLENKYIRPANCNTEQGYCCNEDWWIWHSGQVDFHCWQY